MQLIWLSHFIPYPPRGGAPQRSFHLLRQMSRHCSIFLVAFNRPVVSPPELQECERELRKFCQDVEFWELPISWKGPRWWAELSLAPFFAAPHSCRVYGSKALAHKWQQILRDRPGALVHIDSSDLAFFADATAGHPVVLNHHNCESYMAMRRARIEPNPLKKLYLADQARKQARLEQRLCHRVSVNAVVSEEDGELLRAQDPKAHIHVVENGTDTAYFFPPGSEVEARTLVFAGSLTWYPNQSGLRFFLHDVWPLVKEQVPGVRFYIAGRNPPDWLTRWAGSDVAITLAPSPDDIRPWIARGMVFVCPIIDGGGTRLKILDAMAMGKAIVSTTVGAEGLRVTPGKDILIADTPHDFVREIIRFIQDHELRKRISLAARTLMEREYSWDVIGAHLQEAYRCAREGGNCRQHGQRVMQVTNP